MSEYFDELKTQDFTEIHLDYGMPLTPKILNEYDNKGYTGMLLQLCETSTGILYDMQLVSNFCQKKSLLSVC